MITASQKCYLLLFGALSLCAPALCMEQSIPAIVDAVRKNKITELIQLLEQGVDINEKSAQDYTALHWAARNGHKKIIGLLVSYGADVSARTGLNETPSQLAEDNGHEELATYLKKLALAAASAQKVPEQSDAQHARNIPKNIHHADEDGRTPLFWAAWHGRTDELKDLLAQEAHWGNADKDGKTPLHCAALKGHTKAVKILLSCGADTHAKNLEGKTPLDNAISRGHAEICTLIKDHRLHSLRGSQATKSSEEKPKSPDHNAQGLEEYNKRGER